VLAVVILSAIPLVGIKVAQHSVHPTGGSLRVFRQFAWLEVGSDKMALSCPAHQPVTQAVSPLKAKYLRNKWKAERIIDKD
jgi:hypothetical protein